MEGRFNDTRDAGEGAVDGLLMSNVNFGRRMGRDGGYGGDLWDDGAVLWRWE